MALKRASKILELKVFITLNKYYFRHKKKQFYRSLIIQKLLCHCWSWTITCLLAMKDVWASKLIEIKLCLNYTVSDKAKTSI